MFHRLTLGHLDPTAVARDGGTVVSKPLDMSAVERLLVELRHVDLRGGWTLDGDDVGFHDGYVVVPRQGGWHNLIAEEFALRLQQETGCVIADRERGRIIDPEQLQGLLRAAVTQGGQPT